MLSVETIPIIVALLGSVVSICIVAVERVIMLKLQIKSIKENGNIPFEKHVKNYNKIKLKEV